MLNALGIAIILTFVVGIFNVGKFLWQLVGTPIATHVAPVWSFIDDVFVKHLDGWVTGIATSLLAYFTVTLRTEARRQADKDRPLISILMVQAAGVGAYSEAYAYATDDLDANLVAYQAKELFPHFVTVRVWNEQPTVTGFAVNVEIDAVLFFGVVDNVSSYPYKLERKIRVGALGAGRSIEGNFFNVAGLKNYQIRITRLSYEDASGKIHRGGYGVNRIYKQVDADPTYDVVAFEP